MDYDTNNSLVTTRLFFLFFFERTRFSFSLVLLHISTWCEVMGNIIKDSQWDPLVAHEISIWTPSIIVYASTLWRFLQPPWVLIGPWVIVRNGIFFCPYAIFACVAMYITFTTPPHFWSKTWCIIFQKSWYINFVKKKKTNIDWWWFLKD